MADNGVNRGRRRFLTLTTTAVGAVGVGFLAVPFLKSWKPSAQARAAGAPVEVDVSKVAEGQSLRVKWRGKPILVVHRTQRMLDTLPKLNDQLRDPKSEETTQQPSYCQNLQRSIKPEYFVFVNICTHLGCSPEYVPEPGSKPYNPDWLGGFFCPCHGSMYDLAARVFKGVPAPLNMVVPPYHYIDKNRILVGEDPKGA